VVKNYTEIREGGNGSLLLVKRNGKDKLAAVQLKLSENGNFYIVITAFASSKRYVEKQKALSLGKSTPSNAVATKSDVQTEQQQGNAVPPGPTDNNNFSTTKIEQKSETANQAYDFSDIKPVGRGFFGNIYDQFKGKAREAIAFLMQKKEGEATGALYHKDIGEIDLVWGNDKAGLAHIIDKHIEKHNDFSSVEEAGNVIEDVVTNGAIKEDPQPNRVILEKDGYRVVVSKDVFNNKGEKLGDKNWVVTAFDTTRMPNEKRVSTTATTLIPPDSNKGGRAVASEVEQK